MRAAGVIGIARVVMHTKEHLAVLIPSGAALLLNTIRWATEIRAIEDLKLPATGASAVGLKPAELKMAAQLIGDMTAPWKPQEYADKFSLAIQALVDQKVAAGDTETVTPLEQERADVGSSNVVDLTELLAKSLAKRTTGSRAQSAADSPKKGAPKPSTRKRA